MDDNIVNKALEEASHSRRRRRGRRNKWLVGETICAEYVVSLRALFYMYGHNAELKQGLNGGEARVLKHRVMV